MIGIECSLSYGASLSRFLLAAGEDVRRWFQLADVELMTTSLQRCDANASRISCEKSSGSSQAAKWPPLSTSLK